MTDRYYQLDSRRKFLFESVSGFQFNFKFERPDRTFNVQNIRVELAKSIELYTERFSRPSEKIAELIAREVVEEQGWKLITVEAIDHRRVTINFDYLPPLPL